MSEKDNRQDRLLDELVQRSLVPRGFRPESDEEIFTMLEGLGSGEVSEDKLSRMLGKIRGDSPMAWEAVSEESESWQSDTAEAKELAEMFREKGEDLSPEQESKLREMEKRASELPDEEEDPDGD